MQVFWSKAIMLIDMDAFYASVEQRDNPVLRNKALVVTNGIRASSVITSSYKARSYGIKTGMKIYEAKRLCPELYVRQARHDIYQNISNNIMQILRDCISPDLEVFSIDEAFLDITKSQPILGHVGQIAKLAQKIIKQKFDLDASIGIGGDKTTAKLAAKEKKPKGVFIVKPERAKHYLQDKPLTQLCGVSKGIEKFLSYHNVHYCKDIKKIPISVLGNKYGGIGRRIWYMCQGLDPSIIDSRIRLEKSMSKSKVIPPYTKDKKVILDYCYFISDKLAEKMQKKCAYAKDYLVGIQTNNRKKIANKYSSQCYHNSNIEMYTMCEKFFAEYNFSYPIIAIYIKTIQLSYTQQLDIFGKAKDYNEIYNIVNSINRKCGKNAVVSARSLATNIKDL